MPAKQESISGYRCERTNVAVKLECICIAVKISGHL